MVMNRSFIAFQSLARNWLFPLNENALQERNSFIERGVSI
jgi:hypothetical protein